MLSREEIDQIEDSALSAALDDGAELDNAGHWLGLVIDLCRDLRACRETRGATFYLFPEGKSVN